MVVSLYRFVCSYGISILEEMDRGIYLAVPAFHRPVVLYSSRALSEGTPRCLIP